MDGLWDMGKRRVGRDKWCSRHAPPPPHSDNKLICNKRVEATDTLVSKVIYV